MSARPLMAVIGTGLGIGLGLSACDTPRAFGDVDSIVVAASDELWSTVVDTVQSVLEPQIFTVRRERTFTLTQQDPTGEAWPRLRLFLQVLAIGSESDPWVAQALENRISDEPISPPQILQAEDVWARNQLVTIMLLPEGGGAEEVISLLEPLHELFDEQFRAYALGRMYLSGQDTALADSLVRDVGFTLAIPNVYQTKFQDSTFIFRNENPDPTELLRQVTVTWKSPIPEEVSVDSLLAWRRSSAEVYYQFPQVNDTSEIFMQRGEYRGMPVTEVQATWANPPEAGFPAGGPFILRAIECAEDDRLYLLDAWLYAPNQAKYEYMVQLETILGSFRCNTP